MGLFGIPGFLEKDGAAGNALLYGGTPQSSSTTTSTTPRGVQRRSSNPFIGREGPSAGDLQLQQHEDNLARVDENRGDVDNIVNQFSQHENPFLKQVLDGSLLDSPIYQRLQRQNQGIAAKSLRDMQSRIGASAGARGLKGGGRNALEVRAAEEALASRMNAEADLAKNFTDIYTRTGVAQDSILGSLTNAQINYIGNEEIPQFDFIGNEMDQLSLDNFPDVLNQLMESTGQSQNELLNNPTVKFFSDLFEIAGPIIGNPFTITGQ